MIVRTELITLHAVDLLELLGTPGDGQGSLSLMTDGEEQIEIDLDALCLVVKLELANDAPPSYILPM